MNGEVCKLAEAVFLRPFGGDFLLIRSLPFTVVLIDRENVAQVRRMFENNAAMDSGSPMARELRELGFFSGRPEHPMDPNYVTLLLIASTACNLRCPHCLAGDGDYGLAKANMPGGVCQVSLDYQKKQLENLLRKQLYEEIDLGVFFFGGEPLLNWETIKHTIRSAADTTADLNRSFHTPVRTAFSISTNGTLLTKEVADFAAAYGVEMIISIDGPTHDQHRMYRNGRGSLEQAIAGYRLLVEAGVSIRINTVVLPEDAIRIRERIAWFQETMLQERHENTRVTFSFQRGPVGQASTALRPSCIYSTSCIDTYISALQEFNQAGYETYETELRRKIDAGGTFLKCSAGIERICVVPNGNVYPCQSFIDDRFLIGNVLEPDFTHCHEGIQREFLKRNVFALTPCRDCYLQTICGLSFDCASHSYYDLGDFFKVDPDTCRAGYAVQSKIFDGIVRELLTA